MYNSEFEKCWLDYKKTDDYDNFLKKFQYICSEFDDKVSENAVEEIKTAFSCFFGNSPKFIDELPEKSYILLKKETESENGEEGFEIKYDDKNEILYINSLKSVGALYGAFSFIRKIMQGILLKDMNISIKPEMNIRMINHWDNMKGDIERGYSGDSFFFDDNKIIFNERTKMYARILASIGINSVTINNVNVHSEETYLITDKYLYDMKKYSDLFNSYGIKLFLSVNYAAPVVLGATDNCDPLDKDVIKWWKQTVKHIYEIIPEFGGFLVKADSEGRPGPYTYGRTHAEGANMLADALKKYNGIVIWRCFVYNCRQDWRDYKTDRARAAYDNFAKLDGKFNENVVLQVKNGPVDFQIREPVSPLFGAMKHTNLILEVQIAQEYTGQQIDICYLIPMWKEVLDFNTYASDKNSSVRDIVSGKAYGNKFCGIAGVTNTGCDANWTGNDLAAANLFGYGMLCFNSGYSADEIAKTWITCTFGQDKKVNKAIYDIIIDSRKTYEKYSAPLGIGWMVNPNNHYGPNVDGYEYSVWGTYHRANCHGVGNDRSVKTGTGYAKQYNPPLCDIYEKIETTPEELLLFFHHVSYLHNLSDGRTIIQYIYDSHFEGVCDVKKMIEIFKSVKDKIDSKRYDRILDRLIKQQNNAIEWRDRVNTYFHRLSGIDDEKGRKIY